jgi:mRNA interferase MazF
VVDRFEVYWVSLDPTRGSEIKKTRPCVVISPDEINHHLRTVIIAPLTSTSKPYPTRVACKVESREGWVVLDQLRTVDKRRLGRQFAILDKDARAQVLAVLQEMFS